MILASQNLISFDRELLPNPKDAPSSSIAHSKVKGGKPFKVLDIAYLKCNTMYDLLESRLRILEFEWDEGNVLHFELGHGIEPEEAEEVFVNKPLFRKTRKGHDVAFGPTGAGRYLIVVFETKSKGIVRPMTGWDMNRSEFQYYKRHTR